MSSRDIWGIRAYGGIKLENRVCARLSQAVARSTSGCCEDMDAAVKALPSRVTYLAGTLM
jgi:hypothetical protein